MRICPNCGIEYDNEKGECPLCSKSDVKEPLKGSFHTVYFWDLYSLFSLTAFLIILVIDLAYTSGLDWSRIPLVSIVYSWLVVFMIKKLRHKTILLLILELAATIVTLGLLDIFTPGKEWFADFAFPVLIAFALIFGIIFLITKFYKLSLLSTTSIFIAGVGFFLISLESLLHNFYHEDSKLTWSLIAFVCLLPLLIFFLYLNKIYKTRRNDFKKYFHF